MAAGAGVLSPQETIVDAIAIRDTDPHTPSTDPTDVSFLDCHEFGALSLRIVNDMDQDVVVTHMGNLTNSVADAAAFTATTTVAAGDQEVVTLTPDTSGWMPWQFASLECAVQPTSGSVTIVAVRHQRISQT